MNKLNTLHPELHLIKYMRIHVFTLVEEALRVTILLNNIPLDTENILSNQVNFEEQI